MPLTPEDVSNKRFTPVRLREGYDMGEVDQFLDEVEAELDRLIAESDDLREKLAAALDGRPVDTTPADVPAARTESAPEQVADTSTEPPVPAGEPATGSAAAGPSGRWTIHNGLSVWVEE